MTNTEFNEWLKFLSFRLPSFKTWLDRMKAETRDGMIDLWETDLKNVSPENAAAAVDEIYRGTTPEPKPWDRLPQTVKHFHNLKKPNMPSTYDGEPAHKCLLCRDGGTVAVYSIETQRRALEGNFENLSFTGVGCSCDMGSPYKIRYDENVMCLSDPHSFDKLLGPERLREWAAEKSNG